MKGQTTGAGPQGPNYWLLPGECNTHLAATKTIAKCAKQFSPLFPVPRFHVDSACFGEPSLQKKVQFEFSIFKCFLAWKWMLYNAVMAGQNAWFWWWSSACWCWTFWWWATWLWKVFLFFGFCCWLGWLLAVVVSSLCCLFVALFSRVNGLLKLDWYKDLIVAVCRAEHVDQLFASNYSWYLRGHSGSWRVWSWFTCAAHRFSSVVSYNCRSPPEEETWKFEIYEVSWPLRGKPLLFLGHVVMMSAAFQVFMLLGLTLARVLTIGLHSPFENSHWLVPLLIRECKSKQKTLSTRREPAEGS